MNDAVIVKLDRCAGLLRECKTAQQAKCIADLSEALRVYAKHVRASREVVNQAGELKLRAERKLGQILEKTEKAKRGAGPGRGKVGAKAKPTFGGADTGRGRDL